MSLPPAAREPDEPVFERNLRALLVRCHVPARPAPAFRERARAACLAAVSAGLGAAEPDRLDAARAAPRRLVARVPALAAAALLVVGLTAALWFAAEATGDGRRDAILARGEAAARTGAHGRWQAFGPEPDDDPDAADVAHAELADGSLEVLTPAGLGLDVSLPDLGAGAGAFVDAESRVTLQADAGLDAELQRGGLSLTSAAPAVPWTLHTPQGSLALLDGTLTARLLGPEGQDGVWLLADGRAALPGAGGPRELPARRALRWLHGEVTPLADAQPAHSDAGGPGLHLALDPRATEPLSPRDGAEGAAVASESPPPARAPRELLLSVRRGGEPVTAFRLVLVPQDVPPRPDVVSTEVTAADGRTTWSDLPPGGYTLFVLAPGAPAWHRAGLTIQADDVLAPIDVELVAAGASVTGFVVDARTGAPVAGAVVLSETDAPARLLSVDDTPLPDTVTVLTRSDESGAFKLRDLGPGEQVLRATAPGYAPAWSGSLALAAGEAGAGLLFRLEREAIVSGRVIGTDGRPWAGALVIASPQPDVVRPCVSFAAALTDEHGAYEAHAQPAGSGIVLLIGDAAAQAGGFPVRLQAASLVAGEVATVDFVLAPEVQAADPGAAGCRLHGLLLDVQGVPVPRRMVSIVRQDAADVDAAEQWRGAITTDDGEFSFAALSAGAWELYTGNNDGTSTSFVTQVDVPAAADLEQDVQLADGVLAGQVTRAADGLPVSRAVAILMRATTTGGRDFQGRQLADGTGSFRFDHLAPGRYVVTAHDIDGALAQQTGGEVALTTGAVVEDQSFALLPGASVSVVVRDARGQPVPGAIVRFTDQQGAQHQFAASVRTDAAGRHEARGIGPGLWFVSATPPAGKRLLPREESLQVVVGATQELLLVLPDAP